MPPAFPTCFVAFPAHPVGGPVFGHSNDRIGRTKTLIATMPPTGVATVIGTARAAGVKGVRIVGGAGKNDRIMTVSPSLPFIAMTSPSGDIVVFYVGTEPRMTPEQALAFADQLRDLATEAQLRGLANEAACADLVKC
ncbi:hypothetical protein GCM10010517_16850 [Streptosporangium fragile]|uniref:Uncharacterized protein n=1 Tax=Streptosporangium fragile TaxID=46186 RepID=A0ABP6I967_9ACTN